MKIAFIGNPNCGKTTLFNAYTGARLKVANFPGVTVERVDGEIFYNNDKHTLTDLPGIYSLDSYTLEETISRRFIEEKNADVIINVVDALSLERNLYLTLRLISIGVPVVIALNMMDIVNKRGIVINIEKLKRMLYNTQIIAVSAKKKTGLDLLMAQALKENRISCSSPKRRETIRTDYNYIEYIIKECVEGNTGRSRFSDNMDRILTHNLISIPVFFFAMLIAFFLTFCVGDFFKAYMQKLLNIFSYAVYKAMVFHHVNKWIISLTIDGIIAGVGGILTFIPNIAVLFASLAILEDGGYMPRAAYAMNDIMGKIGISGHSIIMLLLGFGCSVPAVMLTRTLKDMDEKKKTILLIPFMSCAAKLPLYVLFAEIFFRKYRFLVVYSLYIAGILMAVVYASVSHIIQKREYTNKLLIELPEYHIPDAYTVFIYVWEKIKGYIIKAGTVIFISSVALWILMNMGADGAVSNPDMSFAAMFGKFFVPILKPAGLGSWQTVAALIAGLSAKEAIVSGMSLLYNITEINSAQGRVILGESLHMQGFNSANAYALMIFCMLYPPCAATLITIKNETQSWLFTIKMIFSRLALAWLCAVIVYRIYNLLIYWNIQI